MEQKLKLAVQEMLSETEELVSTLRTGSAEGATVKVDAPLELSSTKSRWKVSMMQRRSSVNQRRVAPLRQHCKITSADDRVMLIDSRVCTRTPLAMLSGDLAVYQRNLKRTNSSQRRAHPLRLATHPFGCLAVRGGAGMTALLDQQQAAPEDASAASAESRHGVSIPTSLLMRLIAVLAIKESSGADSAGRLFDSR